MFVSGLNLVFIIIGSLLTFLFCLYKLYIAKLAYSPKISTYVSFLTGVLLLYTFLAIIMGFFQKDIFHKIILILFGLSPFIIGKFATYKTEKYYSLLQILLIIGSIIYII